MKPPGSFTDLEILTGTGGSFIPDDDFILFFSSGSFFIPNFFVYFQRTRTGGSLIPIILILIFFL
jgi:hypothetical protein